MLQPRLWGKTWERSSRIAPKPPCGAQGSITCFFGWRGSVLHSVCGTDRAAVHARSGRSSPTIVNLFGFWLLEIPLAWWLALRAGFASNGVFFSIVIAEAAIAVAGILLFRRGRWKLQKI